MARLSKKILALATVGAVTLFGATGATQAANLTAGKYPVTLAQEQLAGLETKAHKFILGTDTVTCSNAHFDGATALTEPSGLLELAPTYSNCLASGSKPVTIAVNGCTFDLTTETLGLTCPEGKEPGITLTLYANATKHGEKTPLCEYLIEPQSLGEVAYKNVTPTYALVTIESTVELVRKETAKEAECGPEAQTATYEGSTILEARNAGEMVDIGVEGEFTAGEYNATITGVKVRGPDYEFRAPNRAVACPTIHDGTEALAEPSESFKLTPTYGTCSALNFFQATVANNGCWFDLAIGEGSGHAWGGTGQLKCPEGKSGVEIRVFVSAAKHASFESACVYLVEPQEAKGMTYESLTPTYVRVGFNASFTVKRTAGSALICGPATQTFSYTGASYLEVLDEEGAMPSIHVG